MTEAMEYEDEQLVEEQLVEEPLEGEEDDFEDIDEEGDIAADYLEELLDIVDMDGDIDIEVRNNRIYLSVAGSWRAPTGGGRAYTPDSLLLWRRPSDR